MPTLAEQLENVQAAIAMAESAQSVTDTGQTRVMAPLQTLYDREARLLSRISAAAGNNRRLAEF